MPRKSAVSELQAEAVAAESPLRRSSRIVNGNGMPAGISTRRTSQTLDSDTPARATRSRRTSTQSLDENLENKTSELEAAALTEEGSQKEITVPAKRGRKPSITTELSDKEAPEKPKAVRGRRTSRSNSEDIEQEIAQKAAPVRGRRNSANVEPNTEVKSTPKTPARATTRRRSSATENAAIEKVSTPAKRTTRSRKVSTDEVVEETKQPPTRGRRKSVNEEQEEVATPIIRRSRRLSTDDAPATRSSKTVEQIATGSSVNSETEVENLTQDEDAENDLIERNVSPSSLKELNIKVTPLKKRKIIEKVEAELDLSVINESTDDMNSSNHEESLKETTHQKAPTEQFSGDEILPEYNMELPENSKNSDKVANLTHSPPIEMGSPYKSAPNSPSSEGGSTGKKRLHMEFQSDSPLKKSPRLSNTSQKELSPQVSKSSPRISRSVPNEGEGLSFDKKSFVSSGSDDSFRVHLSRISVTESVQTSSHEHLQNELLNASSGSNKENISLSVNSKDVSAPSLVIPLQNKIIVNRVSNVFKPNQKEYSFMEPMEVDSSIIAPNESAMDKSLSSDESSVIFNKKTSKPFTDVSSSREDDETLEESSIEQSALTSCDDSQIQDALERINQVKSVLVSSTIKSSPHSAYNDDLIIEETKTSVNISLNPNYQAEIPPIGDAVANSEASSHKKKRLSRSPTFLPMNTDDGKSRSRLNPECSPIRGNRAARSISRSPLNWTEKPSHSPNVNDNRVDQSFENPKGCEEVFVTSEKMTLDTSKRAEELSVAETSMSNDVTKSGVKYSDSTHYDFDLPSDGDDLLDSCKENALSNSMNLSRLKAGTNEKTKALKIKSDGIVETRSENSRLSSKSIEVTAEHDLTESDVDDVFEENNSADASFGFEITEADAITLRTNDSIQINTQSSINEKLLMNVEENIENAEQSVLFVGKHCEEQAVINNQSNAPFCENNCIDKDNASSNIEGESPKAEEKKPISNKSNTSNMAHGKVDGEKEKNLEDINIIIIDETQEKADHQAKESTSKTQHVELNETTEDNSVCQMAKTVKDENSVSKKCTPSLDAFATARLGDYLKSKAEEVEESGSEDSKESEPEHEYKEFIDGMAEEGEEDTPSEDSNNLIDEGESVGFSDSHDDISEDDYDQDDSFICNEETSELLSGDEYDLSLENNKKTKKSRIIDPNTLGDEDIIKVPKKQTVKDKPKKRSRIVTITDSSSDEEPDIEFETETSKKSEDNKRISQNVEIGNQNADLIEKSKDAENDQNKIREASLGKDDSKQDILKANESNDAILINDSKQGEISIDESVRQNVSLNSSLQRRNRRSSLTIQENIILDGCKDSAVTKRINSLVESFRATVQKGEIAINLSLEYEDLQEPLSAKEINILSDVKICSGSALDDQRSMQQEEEGKLEKKESVKDCCIVDESEDLNKKNLKRRLSKSMSEVYEEDKKSKRRKRNKKSKKSASEEKLFGETDKFSKKSQQRLDLAEDLKTASLNLMSQLITDVKNRPRRVVKPTTSSIADSSWIATKVSNLKPSTTPACREEKRRIVPMPKLHPKDFKNQMLSDAKRVKRVETKILLKRRGAFL